MTYAPKVILKLPMADPDLLPAFVENCVRDKVELIAIWGPKCSETEGTIDLLLLGDGTDECRFIVTTSHDDETLEDVINMVQCWSTKVDCDAIQIIAM